MIETINNLQGSGKVQCRGMEWTARAAEETDIIEKDKISWNVLCKYSVEKIENDKSITLKVNDGNAVGATIKLQLIVDGNVVAEKDISIIVGF